MSDTLQGGNYDLLRHRLEEQATQLFQANDALNTQRQAIFGSVGLSTLGHERLRTENHCIPCDIVSLGHTILLGYNVFVGLKRQIAVGDVFSLHALTQTDAGYSFSPVSDPNLLSFLEDKAFIKDFEELYQYYKDVRLIQLRATESQLLAVFQIGATARDVKVLRWAIDPNERITYVDNRGERDHIFPPTHDFEWTKTTRENHILGRHPHINILDRLFVETVGGDLTIKIENNTQDGKGIYSESVDDPNQSLDDADIQYAQRGNLTLLKIRPYRENSYRYLIYNSNTQSVSRFDAIGSSCVSLPEDHGLLFPGGYYLRTGEFRSFEGDSKGFELYRTLPSPNGEDVLYVFHCREDGRYGLYAYNIIRKEISSPIFSHGYSLFANGTLVVLRATEEPTRVHPVQFYTTPFVSAEHHAAAPSDGSPLAKIGNRDLVRGISEAFTLVRLIRDTHPTRGTYDTLIRGCQRFLDAFPWSHGDEAPLAPLIDAIRRNGELVVDEFAKIEVLKKRAVEALTQAETAQSKLLAEVRPELLRSVNDYLTGLTKLRSWRGHLVGLKDIRFIQLEAIPPLEAQVVERSDQVGKAAVNFLKDGKAFLPLRSDLEALLVGIVKAIRSAELPRMAEQLDAISSGITLLGEFVAGLSVDDPSQKTVILDGISEIVAIANRARAVLDGQRRTLRTTELKSDFLAQFKLFGQTLSAAILRCDTPDACDEQLGQVMLQIEDLESRFGDLDEFLPQLAEQREEAIQAFGGRKQNLLDERQRRISSLHQATTRILDGLKRRASTFNTEADLRTHFVADPSISKLHGMFDQLRRLGDVVKADEFEAQLKASHLDAQRGLRDRLELSDGGTNQIRLGKHRFNIHTQPLELSLVPHDGQLAFHLNGTDFFEPADIPEIELIRPFWSQSIVSENDSVYRGEYLAFSILTAEENGLIAPETLLRIHTSPQEMLSFVQSFSAQRHEEGYDRGVHDVDAAKILSQLISLRQTADQLRFSSRARSLAALYWAFAKDHSAEKWIAQARALAHLRASFGPSTELRTLCTTFAQALSGFAQPLASVGFTEVDAQQGGEYLFEVLSRDPIRFIFRHDAARLRDVLGQWLDDHEGRMAFEDGLRPLQSDGFSEELFSVYLAWLGSLAKQQFQADMAKETATLIFTERHLDEDITGHNGIAVVEGLLGQHPRIRDGKLELRLDEFLTRLNIFHNNVVPKFQAWRKQRALLLEQQRRQLRLDELKPKVMSAFVRNQLVDQVYLPLVGDNLAKQLGAAGEGRRTDQMGLLLLVSPPGYGKTTLMEYVAHRLGLSFVKINGPALGHAVTSLDPAEAPNATARQEIEKIGLALEMGSNVMLYIDDIQHCHSEFLQKFISLCDAQRRIEGVWRGKTRTYDLRGKKFCIVMAGNPYTESGEKFTIPDMLANRADTYNLGEVLGGKEDQFALSFLENAKTSNPVLAPFAAREPTDFHKLARMAQGEEIPLSELVQPPSNLELTDILAILRHLIQCQKTLLAVNAEYIRSAAMEDAYRTEPRFQLQGSYRNMNKLAEKLVPAMTSAEVEQVITDHYAGESQTLTGGTEANLLKLAELRGIATPTQLARWNAIREEFCRRQMIGDEDPATRIASAISGIVPQLHRIGYASPTSTSNPLEFKRDEARKFLLSAIHNTLVEIPTPPPEGDPVLMTALTVIETLMLYVTSAAKPRLNNEDFEDFLTEVSQAVQTALRDTSTPPV